MDRFGNDHAPIHVHGHRGRPLPRKTWAGSESLRPGCTGRRAESVRSRQSPRVVTVSGTGASTLDSEWLTHRRSVSQSVRMTGR